MKIIFHENLEKLKNKWKITTVLYFFAYFSLLYVRSSFSFEFPSLYAEDGSWTGDILTDGFWAQAFGARKEFPVFILVLLQWLSIKLTLLITPSDISFIATTQALISCVFISIVAIMPRLILSNYIGILNTFILGLMIVLIPVGGSGYEIFGRISNLVWYLPILNTFILVGLLYETRSKFHTVIGYLLVLGLCLSFPICFLQFIAFSIFMFLNYRNDIRCRFIDISLIALIFFATATILFTGEIFGNGGINEEVIGERMIEFVIARSTLFPLIAPFYQSLNDLTVVIILLTLILFTAIYILKFRQEHRWLGLSGFMAVNFCLILLSLIAMRPGLTSFLHGYTATYPDRYFISVNLSVLLLMFVLFGKKSWIFSVFTLCTILSWIIFSDVSIRGSIHESHVKLGTFRQTVCDKHNGRYDELITDENSEIVSLPIYPYDANLHWRINLPRYLYMSSVALNCMK